MNYRKLGTAGIKVSTIALGGWINYGEGKVPTSTARQIVMTAYDQGINYFDLADVYGNGGAEEQMGKMLSQFPRHTLVIATKLFGTMSNDINDRGLSRKHIMESIDKSLHRLGTDYVDLYFCHRADPDTPMLETIRAMHDLIQQGKVLYWGTSEWSAAEIQEAHDLCHQHGLYEPVVEQPQYSMLYRERVEEQILPTTTQNGMGLVVWSPLAMGMLTGKYDDGVDEDTRFGREEWARDRFFTDKNVEKVKQLKPIADELGVTRAQLALGWVLRQSAVSSAITSATRPSQIEDSAKAGTLELSDEVVAMIQEVLSD